MENNQPPVVQPEDEDAAATLDVPTAKDLYRMAEWLVIAVVLYALATILAANGTVDHPLLPQVQILCWKAGHATMASYLGYWISRKVMRHRITATSEPHQVIARAIIVGCCILAVSLGA